MTRLELLQRREAELMGRYNRLVKAGYDAEAGGLLHHIALIQAVILQSDSLYRPVEIRHPQGEE